MTTSPGDPRTARAVRAAFTRRTCRDITDAQAEHIAAALLAGKYPDNPAGMARRIIETEDPADLIALADGGPWPPAPAPAPVLPPPGKPSRPPWCGRCDRRTRLAETSDGRARRCPACHPLAGKALGGDGRHPNAAEMIPGYAERAAQVRAYYAEAARRQAAKEPPQWQDRPKRQRDPEPAPAAPEPDRPDADDWDAAAQPRQDTLFAPPPAPRRAGDDLTRTRPDDEPPF